MTQSGSQNPLAVFSPAPGRSGQPLQSPGTTVRIGQGPQNDIILDDDTVSTNHARLEFADGGWLLTDLGSRNGTFVGGARLPAGSAAPLGPETPVAFGGVKLIFTPSTAGVAPAPEAPSRTAAAPPARLADRPGFRLPVWVLLLIIVVLAVIVAVVLWLGGSVGAPVTAGDDAILLLAFQITGSAL